MPDAKKVQSGEKKPPAPTAQPAANPVQPAAKSKGLLILVAFLGIYALALTVAFFFMGRDNPEGVAPAPGASGEDPHAVPAASADEKHRPFGPTVNVGLMEFNYMDSAGGVAQVLEMEVALEVRYVAEDNPGEQGGHGASGTVTGQGRLTAQVQGALGWIKDRITTIVYSYHPSDLQDEGVRHSMKERIVKEINDRLGEEIVSSVYFTKFNFM
jgi:flagellar basal body-associated protein FliL